LHDFEPICARRLLAQAGPRSCGGAVVLAVED
jgi:hypothetical protein